MQRHRNQGMSTMGKSLVASILNSLIEVCEDGHEGFRSAADNVDAADFKTLFNEFAVQRQQFAEELSYLVENLGEKAESGGTFGGAFRRGWR
jgi:uncharacterized protein (TIGR02284 family)